MKRQPPKLKGAAARDAKLTIEQARFIKAALLVEKRNRPPGRKYRPWGMRVRLAQWAGCSVSLIREIDKGRRWGWLKVYLRRGDKCFT